MKSAFLLTFLLAKCGTVLASSHEILHQKGQEGQIPNLQHGLDTTTTICTSTTSAPIHQVSAVPVEAASVDPGQLQVVPGMFKLSETTPLAAVASVHTVANHELAQPAPTHIQVVHQAPQIHAAVAAVPGIGAIDEWVAGVGSMREDGQCGCHCFCSADVFPQSLSSETSANAPASSVQATTLVTTTRSDAAIPSQVTATAASETSTIVVSPVTQGQASSSSAAGLSEIVSSSIASDSVSSKTAVGTEQASQSNVVSEATTSEIVAASVISVTSTTSESSSSTTAEAGAESATGLTDSQALTSAGVESAAASTATDSEALASTESEAITSPTPTSEEASTVASGSSIVIPVNVTPPPLAVSRIADANALTKEIPDLAGLDLRSSIVAGSFSLPQFS